MQGRRRKYWTSITSTLWPAAYLVSTLRPSAPLVSTRRLTPSLVATLRPSGLALRRETTAAFGVGSTSSDAPDDFLTRPDPRSAVLTKRGRRRSVYVAGSTS